MKRLFGKNNGNPICSNATEKSPGFSKLHRLRSMNEAITSRVTDRPRKEWSNKRTNERTTAARSLVRINWGSASEGGREVGPIQQERKKERKPLTHPPRTLHGAVASFANLPKDNHTQSNNGYVLAWQLSNLRKPLYRITNKTRRPKETIIPSSAAKMEHEGQNLTIGSGQTNLSGPR